MYINGDMGSVNEFLDDLQAGGRYSFSSEEAILRLKCSADAWGQSAVRLVRSRRLVSPRRGFYLILRPEDQVLGAPDPVRWIDAFMHHLKLDYRISMLRAAAFHGSSHQSAMLFQLIVPRQVRPVTIGRHKLQFIYQSPASFAKVNRPDWLGRIKSDTGFAQIAGIELTLLDSIRYFHKAAGINGAAQIAHDLGAKAVPGKLAKIAVEYEQSAVRRLGYLLERFGHARQASALLPIASKAKSMKSLDPSLRPVGALAAGASEMNETWKLEINVPVEIDS